MTTFGFFGVRDDCEELCSEHVKYCEQNPANKLSCQFCGELFQKTKKDGDDFVTDRDRHEQGCAMNPANRCQYCEELFDAPILCTEHTEICKQNPKNRCSCPHCGRLFVSLYGFYKRDCKEDCAAHVKVCDQNPANRCPHCKKLFEDPYECETHAQICDDNPENHYQCNFCEKKFGDEARKLKHENACSSNPANTCPYCKFVFANVEVCKDHASICEWNPANRFFCAFCEESFGDEAKKNKHENGCSSNPANTCPHCEILFANVETCSDHARACQWNPANRYECTHCGKVFIASPTADSWSIGFFSVIASSSILLYSYSIIIFTDLSSAVM